jgi:Cu/Zn superoxide dismutase
MSKLLTICVIVACVAMVSARTYRVSKARAVIRESWAAENEIRGTIDFTRQSATDILVEYSVAGLADGESNWHVHQFGDLGSLRGNGLDSLDKVLASTGGHFAGNCDNCRPSLTSPLNSEVGAFAVKLSSSEGSAVGQFVDTIVRLEGENSIVGRSIVIHAADGARIAAGVIGMLEVDSEAASVEPPSVWRASCHFQPTDQNESGDDDVLGSSMTFEAVGNDEYRVTYALSAVEVSPSSGEGLHGVHVHVLGDVSSADATATLGHFVGDCDACRPNGVAQEVGMLGDGHLMVRDPISAMARGYFVDKVIRLGGDNSIVGRSVVAHAAGDESGRRIAQCVIGIGRDGEGSAPAAFTNWRTGVQAVAAQCVVQSSDDDDDNGVAGVVDFELDVNDLSSLRVRYLVSGLGDDGAKYDINVLTQGNACNNDAAGDHFASVANDAVADGHLIAGQFVVDAQQLSLRQDASIVGRALEVRRDDGSRVGACVIGASRYGDPGGLTSMNQRITQAGCRLQPTYGNSVHGYVSIEEHGAEPGSKFVARIVGFASADQGVAHGWHVHTIGSIVDPRAVATDGHFKGSCAGDDACRPLCPPSAQDEDGQIGGCEHPLVPDTDNVAELEFDDPIINLRSIYSVVGRAIVVHAPSGARIGQCVIGAYFDNQDGQAPKDCSLLDDDSSASQLIAVTLALPFVFIHILF